MGELEVHFLFPNLSEEHRGLLTRLALENSRCLITMNPLLPDRAKNFSAEGKDTLHNYSKQATRGFMAAKEAVEESGLIDLLTPLQKEIMKNEFLEVKITP